MVLEFSIGGLALAALVVLAGTVVRARQADRGLARRWLFFLFSVSVLLYGTQFLILRWEMYKFGAFLQPALHGTLAALLVHLGATTELWSRETIWITLPTTVVIVALMGHWWKEMDPLLVLITAITALAWQAWEWRGRRRWLVYLALLLLLLIVGAWMLNPNAMLVNGPRWLHDLVSMVSLFIWPIVAVVLAARLVYASLANAQPSNRLITVIRLALVALLLLVIGGQIVTETMWVLAEDSLSVIPLIVFLVATASAMLLAWAVTGWRRLAPLLFALLVTLTASYAFELGSRTSPSALTEARAEKTNRVRAPASLWRSLSLHHHSDARCRGRATQVELALRWGTGESEIQVVPP